jgi:hypothetical protein
MPVRRKIAGEITELFTGTHIWNGLIGECQTMPTAEFDKARDAADLLFEYVVDRIDWPRVLLEATSRHMALILGECHPKAGSGWRARGVEDDLERPCPACIREALLTDDRMSEWVVNGQPIEAPRRRWTDPRPDYAADLARAVTFRQPNHRPR